MKLPFFKKKSDSTESYFGLFLQENKVTGYVYELLGDRISLLAQHSASLSNGMDNIVEDIDDILFRLETDTSKKLAKTIFFVTSQYLDEETKQIKKECRPIIKKITQELELEAMGFIECFEAIAALLSKKEGVHLNLILIELGEKTGNVFLYKNDKQVFSTSFARTDKLVEDLTEILTETKKNGMLPSRIVLYPYSNTQKEVVHLVNHTWSHDLFVHMPKIETLSEEDLHKGLSEIFYAQLKEDAPSAAAAAVPSSKEREEAMETDKAETIDEIQNAEHGELAVAPKEVLGFAIGADVTPDIAEKEGEVAPLYEDEKSIDVAAPSEKKPFFLTSFFAKMKNSSEGGAFPMKTPVIIVAIALVVLSSLFFGSEYFLHKEVVKVKFPTKDLETEVTVTNDDLDISTGSVSADVSDSVTTTGKKDVGEKAKGEVTIRSFDDKEKSIAKGTVLEVDSKKFLLDQDVKVASASVSSDNSSKIAGQVKGNVTADTLGTEYNLEKNKKFKIGDLDFSTFFAINDNAFTGGTKKQAQTVAKKDIEDLRKKVLAAGKKQGLEKMRSEVSEDQQIIDTLTEQELDEVDFSKEVGDEAKEVTVNARVATTYYAYSENDLKKLLKSSMEPEVDSGYTLPAEKISADITEAEVDNKKITLTVNSTGKSVKQISKDELLSAVKGSRKTGVSELLQSRFEAEEAEVEDVGPSFFPWMPIFKKNITIEINSL